LLDASFLIPVFNLSVDTQYSHNTALTELQRATGGFNLDMFKGTHFRLGVHYVL